MAKNHRKGLSAAQRAKRRARMRRLLGVLAWLDPISATIMAHKLIAEKVQKMIAAKKASKAHQSILQDLQGSIAASLTPPIGGATIDSLSASLSDTGYAPHMSADGFADSLHDAGSDTPDAVKSAFTDAKAAANKLTGADKDSTLASIAELEKSVATQKAAAKTEIKTVDKADVNDAKAALVGVDMASVAHSATSAEVETVGSAEDEIESLFAQIPTWAYITVAGVTVAGIIYWAVKK